MWGWGQSLGAEFMGCGGRSFWAVEGGAWKKGAELGGWGVEFMGCRGGAFGLLGRSMWGMSL